MTKRFGGYKPTIVLFIKQVGPNRAEIFPRDWRFWKEFKATEKRTHLLRGIASVDGMKSAYITTATTFKGKHRQYLSIEKHGSSEWSEVIARIEAEVAIASYVGCQIRSVRPKFQRDTAMRRAIMTAASVSETARTH